MIVIGTPHAGAIAPEWLIAWERLALPPGAVALRTLRLPVHTARNQIVATTLERYPAATHLLFLDDDTLPPPDGILRLLQVSEATDAPVVTGLCTQRSGQYLPCVYHAASDGKYAHLVRFGDHPQEIDACGAACLLVRTDVLRALAATGEPWFAWPANGHSEDITFCERVRAAGYSIVLDPSVRCVHLGVLESTYELFQRETLPELTYATAEVARLAHETRPWPRQRAYE